ncbi:helix-turn-helix domain-containing protein [Pseudoteredinibacter isoporae]|uniref:helix-turn-helix domain-containing protein n=1 Tax=Pseudoteredinibacter isoporae TaxID=570281 RepID=UPI003106FAF8
MPSRFSKTNAIAAEKHQVLARGDLFASHRNAFGVHLERQQLDELGLDGTAEILACGIPPIALEDPDYPIEQEQEQAVLLRLIEANHPKSHLSLALETGANASITLFGLLGLTAMHADSILHAVQTILSFPELTWGQSQIELGRSKHHDYCYFDLSLEPRLGQRGRQLQEFCLLRDLVSSSTLIQDIAGPDCAPVAVHLPFPEGDEARDLQQHFQGTVHFGQARASLQLPLGYFDRLPLRQNQAIYRAYLKLVQRVSADLRRQSRYGELVKRQLQLQAVIPDRDTLAHALNVSPRTLARKLEAEGISFKQLRREVQQSRAEQALSKEALSMGELAEQLGFTDSAAFSRAFKGWTGVAPTEWKKQALTNN